MHSHVRHPEAAQAERSEAAPVFEAIENLERLEALALPWDALASRSAGAHLFQSHPWVCAWLRHVPRGRPFVLVARRGERLTAAIPMCFQERGAGPLRLRTLQMTSPFADFADALCAPEHPEDLRGLWSWLLGRGDWHLMDLQFVRPGSLLSELGSTASDTVLQVRAPQTVAPFIDLTVHWQDSASNEMVARLRRKRRRLADRGPVSLTLASTPAEVERLVAEFVALHVQRWQAKGAPSDFRHSAFQAFLREVCLRQLELGHLRLYRLAAGETTVAIGIYFLFGRSLAPYTFAFSPEFEKLTPMGLLMVEILEEAQAKGLADVYDFGAGGEEYKSHWTKKSITLERALIAPRTPKGRAAFLWSSELKRRVQQHPRLLAELRRLRQAGASLLAPARRAAANAPG